MNRMNCSLYSLAGVNMMFSVLIYKITAALAAMMDNFPPKSYAAKPCATVAYSMGRSAGTSCAVQLRQFATELAMVPLQVNFCLSSYL